MKLLLDENLPRKLKRDLAEHEVYTVRDSGWSGLKNGELIRKMLENDFEVLLTFDKNIQHQQNFSKYPITVFLLTAQSNQYRDLEVLVDTIKTKLEDVSPGVFVIA